MKVPANSLAIPVSNLSTGNKLMCSDGEWRDVTKIDYIYDVDASVMSNSYAVAYCGMTHRQLVKDYVYIYNAAPTSPASEGARKTPKKKKKLQKEEGFQDLPDDAA